MPLHRNIAGFQLGLLYEPSAYDTMRALSEEGGGGGYLGPVEPEPIFPVNPNPVYYDPVPIRPVEPVEDIIPIYPPDHINELPAPNQVQVLPPGGKVKVLPLLAVAGAVLAMTGLHPLKKIGSGVLFSAALVLVYLQLRSIDKAGPGVPVVAQPNTL